MNVRLSLLVTRMHCAPTHLDPSCVHATQGTEEMERRAMVGANRLQFGVLQLECSCEWPFIYSITTLEYNIYLNITN